LLQLPAPVPPSTKGEPPSLAPPVSEASLTGLSGDADDDPDDPDVPISEEKRAQQEKIMAVKNKFYELLDAITKVRKVKILTDEEYGDVMKVVREWRSGETHSSLHSKWHENYYVIENTSRSAALRRRGTNLKVATKEQMFAIIMGTHQLLAHGRDKRAIHSI
jgi:hypothetical protein